jgi:hypothetical protein
MAIPKLERKYQPRDSTAVLNDDAACYTFLCAKDPASIYAPDEKVIAIPFLNICTFVREWAALHSIRSHELLPLSPYLLKASPIISISRLRCSIGHVFTFLLSA